MTKRVSLLTVLTLDSWTHISVFYFIAVGSYRYFKNHWFLRKKTQILIYCQQLTGTINFTKHKQSVMKWN